MSHGNREQIEFWNEQAGPTWVVHQERLDRQIRPHGERALEALDLAEGERVIDIGCGCGGSTLEIARRVGRAGDVLGVDVSEPMLARARERARQEDLPQARFLRADAQEAELGRGAFDAAYSRFGIMFFGDPHAAFGNLRQALRPEGRLTFVCWQPARENPWVLVPAAAVASRLPLPAPPDPEAPGMFSFGDAARVRGILGGAGFGAVELEDLRLPMRVGGGSLDEAVELFLEVGPVAAALREAEAGPAEREAVRRLLRETFDAHATDGELVLESAAWVVSARRED